MSDKRYLHPIQFVEIGQLIKPFGLKGDLRYALLDGLSLELSEIDYIWLFCFGCWVPHALENVDPDHQRLRLAEVDSIDAAKEFSQIAMALPKEQLVELRASNADPMLWLVDYQIKDLQSGISGLIVQQQEMGPQIMLTVEVGAKQYWIPLVDEWIRAFDSEEQLIEMELPINMFSNPINN